MRFRNPEPTEGWEGILDGTQLTPSCPQFLTGVVKSQEDCLFVNVYSSRSGNETGREPAPVMVFMCKFFNHIYTVPFLLQLTFPSKVFAYTVK